MDSAGVYIADEVFLCGTGFEVAPVGWVDRFQIGDWTAGRLTCAVRRSLTDVARGVNDKHAEWRIAVYV